MATIMIVEDDRQTNDAVAEYLKSFGYRMLSAYDGDEALQLFECNNIDLIILDIMIPKKTGLAVLHTIRAKSSVPILMLTAIGDEYTQVTSFDEQADDYITKPFFLAILRARVNTQLRKHPCHDSKTDSSVITIDNFSFDFVHLNFFVSGTPVELSKTEQKLLCLLVENRGHVMTRDILTDRIWTDCGDYVDNNALSVVIKRLRDKLGASDYIHTIYGIGYKWDKK